VCIRTRDWAPMLLAVSITACTETAADPLPERVVNEQRQLLSEGYSLLYTDASHIALMKLVLYVKIESDAFDKLVTGLSEYGGELKKDLERIARDYPGVRIDLDPLPEMEKRKRFAVGKDRAFQFAPLSGHGGVEYERTMLISIANALNHESHLCQVMAAEEPDPGLQKFLRKSEQRYIALHLQVVNLLNREHFRSDPGRSARP